MLSFKPVFSLSSYLHQEDLSFLFTFCHKGGVICISEIIDLLWVCLYAIFFSSRYSSTIFIDPWLVESMDKWYRVKNPPANSGDSGDSGSIPGLGISPGEGNGKPLQYSCLENSKDRRIWWAAVHGVKKSWTEHTPTHTSLWRADYKLCRDFLLCRRLAPLIPTLFENPL